MVQRASKRAMKKKKQKQAQSQARQAAKKPQKKRSVGRTLLIWGVSIVVLIALLALLFVGLRYLKDNASKEDVDPYDDLKLSKYVKLPDYSNLTVDKPVPEEVTDADVEAEIQKRLTAAGTTDYETEGTVQADDVINISYKGSLPGGESPEELNGSSVTLTLGVEPESRTLVDVVEGFRECLVGATVGKTFTKELTLPDPFGPNPDLSGKTVEFVITVNNRAVTQVPALDAEFTLKDGGVDTVEAYRDYIRQTLETDAEKTALDAVKMKILDDIIGESEILSYPEDLVEPERTKYDDQYRAQYDRYYSGMSWEDYLREILKIDPDDYDATVEQNGKDMVRNKLVLYAVAAQEKIDYPEDSYQQYLMVMQLQYGYQTASEFTRSVGMSPARYGELYYNYYGVRATALIDKVINVLYDKLAG